MLETLGLEKRVTEPRAYRRMVLRRLSVDDLKAQLGEYESKYGMKSEEFYRKVFSGELEEHMDFISWLGDYEQYLRLTGRGEGCQGGRP